MDKSRTIPLKETVPSSASIVFLSAEVPETQSPFAMVWYSFKGSRQEYALRLDMDKGIFLDHLEDKEDDEFIRRVAPKIVERVGDFLYTTDVS